MMDGGYPAWLVEQAAAFGPAARELIAGLLSLHAYLNARRARAMHALDLRVAEAQQSGLGYLEFLSLLIDDETQSRENNMLAKRLKAAAGNTP